MRVRCVGASKLEDVVAHAIDLARTGRADKVRQRLSEAHQVVTAPSARSDLVCNAPTRIRRLRVVVPKAERPGDVPALKESSDLEHGRERRPACLLAVELIAGQDDEIGPGLVHRVPEPEQRGRVGVLVGSRCLGRAGCVVLNVAALAVGR